MIQLRRETALVRQAEYLHGELTNIAGWKDIGWFRPDGQPVRPGDWSDVGALCTVVTSTSSMQGEHHSAIALLLNPTTKSVEFRIPEPYGTAAWRNVFSTDPAALLDQNRPSLTLSTRTVALLALTQQRSDMS
jgi:pullulanase/glycogen debranching enzyme